MFGQPQHSIPPDGAVSHAGLEAARNLLANTPLRRLGPVLERWFLQDLEQIYSRVGAGDTTFFSALLESLNIVPEYAAGDLENIPRQGPVIVVANHPFGLAEGVILGAILSTMRSDVTFLANSMLAVVPQLQRLIIPVDISGGADAVRANWKSVRKGIEWLRADGLLVVFPAGEVASIQFPRLEITDPGWTDCVSRLVQRTSASVVPVFFHGANGPAFHIAGLIHPRLRTLLLPRELLNKGGRSLRISIGRPIHSQRLAASARRRNTTEYLRARTFLLEARAAKTFSPPIWLRARRAEVPEGRNSRLLWQEVGQLPSGQRLVTHGEFVVCAATAEQIPNTLREIGRPREITFRQAGEGTGRAVDLDAFDRHYTHLFLWNEEKCEIAGAYRFARTDDVVARWGLHGLYTSTLFRLSRNFYAAIQPALELGRSFVTREYQKGYLPLLLLWKGLGQYVASHPQYRVLFGPVSISNAYSRSSRELMVSFLRSRCRNESLAAHIQPKRKFRVRAAGDCDPRNFGTLLANVDELSEIVADLEPDHKGVPILLQHYLHLGGQILDFSVDNNFSQALDGLIVVDLAKANRRLLERYLSKEGAEQFLLRHSVH
jgi:putative hemolysin